MLLTMALPADAATVKVTVNGSPITDVQISQRLGLFKLENKSGAKVATAELIEETLMIQEAQRLGFTVTESEVNDAVLQVARNIKVSPDNLKKLLTDRGINFDTLRDRLRSNIAWSKVTQTAISATVQISDADLDVAAKEKLTTDNSYDYLLKQIIFLMPGGKGNASKRTAEANQYRKSFNGCDSAVQLSLSYTDAAVTDLGRRHATQLEEPIANELAKLNVGGITKPRVISGGVSMLAVCAKSVARGHHLHQGQPQAGDWHCQTQGCGGCIHGRPEVQGDDHHQLRRPPWPRPRSLHWPSAWGSRRESAPT